MTTFTVTAANKFFWQTLAIEANSIEEASEKFNAYLAAPQQQADEKYEYDQQWAVVNGQLDVEQPDRDDYTYAFCDDHIEEDDTVTATAEVRMVQSGGNG